MASAPSTIQLPTNTEISGRNLHSGVPAFRLIDGQLGLVKKLVTKQLVETAQTEEVNRLLEPRLVGTRGGKMLRPGLVLLAGASCGRITSEHIRVAAVIEMIHNATLLHDDVIDEGKTRRGLPTVNSLWGNQSAVLLGDFLLGRVLKMCADLEPWIARVIATAAVRVCEGELRQAAQRQNWQLSETQYLEIITEKSAALFSCCCYLGGLLARASESEARSLADFGLNAGIAFQITDDLLDIIGDESKTGKTLGSDVDKNKPTLAVIHFLKTAQETDITEIKSKLTTAGASKKVLAEMLSRYGSLEYAQTRAHDFAARAVQALADLKKSDARDALVETAEFMASRIT